MICKSQFIGTASAIFLGCKSNDSQKLSIVAPLVQYELSGGAGQNGYASSAIVDKKSICYMFLCENKDSFKIVDHVYMYKGIPSSKAWVWQPGT